MVATILSLIFVSGFYPIACAARSNRKTTLLYAIAWALIAWFFWSAANVLTAFQKEPESSLGSLLALAFSGCTSVAVLGARRPGVGAWNFVIIALLIVMVFLWVEGMMAGNDAILRNVRTILLASTVAIGVLNYLPTRLAPAALMLAIGCGLEIVMLTGSESLQAKLEAARPMGPLALASVPWIGLARMRWRPQARSEFDQVWLDFRDRFGLVWAQRLREQFNASASHADWPVVLRWTGLRFIPGTRRPSPQEQEAMLDNLRALMKRFRM
jgi:hypothetical protein